MAKPQETEPEAAAPRLYLVAAADCPPAELTAALEAADIACVLLLAGQLDEDALRAAVEVLCPLAQARDVAVLLLDRVTLAAETGCDGVHLSDLESLAAARQRLGTEALIGVGCGASRHDAITAAERGADYVAFGAPEPDPSPADPATISYEEGQTVFFHATNSPQALHSVVRLEWPAKHMGHVSLCFCLGSL